MRRNGPPRNYTLRFRDRNALRGISLQENLARFRTIAGADDAALFEDIDHAGGAGVAEAEAALEQGGAIAESAASQGKDSGCCALGKV